MFMIDIVIGAVIKKDLSNNRAHCQCRQEITTETSVRKRGREKQ